MVDRLAQFELERAIWKQAANEISQMVEYVRDRYSLSHPDCAAVFQKEARSLERSMYRRSREGPDEVGGALVMQGDPHGI